MENFLSLPEIVPTYTNELSLIYAVKNGNITPYDKKTLAPIDIIDILYILEKSRKHINLQREGPEWAIDKNTDLPNDNELFPIFEIVDDCDGHIRKSWTIIYTHIQQMKKCCEIEGKYGFDTCQIPSNQFFELWDGIGSRQILEIIKESVFKESDLIKLISTNENQEVTISIEQLAIILDTAKNTVKSWTKKGLLPDKQVGGNKKILLLPESILKWMQQQAHKAEKNNENAALHKWNNRIEKFKKWLETNK